MSHCVDQFKGLACSGLNLAFHNGLPEADRSPLTTGSGFVDSGYDANPGNGERLFLVSLTLQNAEQVQPLFGTWELVRYLNGGVPWPYPAGAAHAFYRDVALPAIERGDEWHWTLRLKEAPDQIIGAGALHRHETNNRGFWIGVPWRSRGLMLEAVEAATDFWFASLGFQVLRASKASENTGSVRISEKTGMHLLSRRDQDFVSGILPAEGWVISREEWLQRRAL